MVKSVIGGFQKIPKINKYYQDDSYENISKKKKKIKRKQSKFDTDTNKTEDNFEEEDDYE